jgi:FMN phosphatase YigB (HAD superfamily)
MALAFFDLDGTLTRFDTLIPYSLIALIHRLWRIGYIKQVLKDYIGFRGGRIERQRLKENFMTSLMGGCEHTRSGGIRSILLSFEILGYDTVFANRSTKE